MIGSADGVEKASRGEAGSGLVFLHVSPGEEGDIRSGNELSEPVFFDPFGMFRCEPIAATGGEFHDEDATADDQTVGPVTDPAA